MYDENNMDKCLAITVTENEVSFALCYVPVHIELLSGKISNIGYKNTYSNFRYKGEFVKQDVEINNHVEAVQYIINYLLVNKIIESLDEISLVGHKVNCTMDENAIEFNSNLELDLLDVSEKELEIINYCSSIFPNDVPQVLVSNRNFYKPIEHKIAGFVSHHGLVNEQITEVMNLTKQKSNLIICNMDDQLSIASIKNGNFVDGNVDTASLYEVVVEFLREKQGVTFEEMFESLNKDGIHKNIQEILTQQTIENFDYLIDMLSIHMAYHISDMYTKNNKNVSIVFTGDFVLENPIIQEKIMGLLRKQLKVNPELDYEKGILIINEKYESEPKPSISYVPVYTVRSSINDKILDELYKFSNKKQNKR